MPSIEEMSDAFLRLMAHPPAVATQVASARAMKRLEREKRLKDKRSAKAKSKKSRGKAERPDPALRDARDAVEPTSVLLLTPVSSYYRLLVHGLAQFHGLTSESILDSFEQLQGRSEVHLAPGYDFVELPARDGPSSPAGPAASAVTGGSGERVGANGGVQKVMTVRVTKQFAMLTRRMDVLVEAEREAVQADLPEGSDSQSAVAATAGDSTDVGGDTVPSASPHTAVHAGSSDGGGGTAGSGSGEGAQGQASGIGQYTVSLVSWLQVAQRRTGLTSADDGPDHAATPSEALEGVVSFDRDEFPA